MVVLLGRCSGSAAYLCLSTPRCLRLIRAVDGWTRFLLPECISYIGVNLAPNCINTCQKGFADDTHATFAVTDGMTLPMVPDESTNLVFSFDFLVHVEADVIASYLRGFQRILSADGAAFIYHSNVGIYRRSAGTVILN